eukprot:2460847-Rhodomonas_salina.1
MWRRCAYDRECCPIAHIFRHCHVDIVDVDRLDDDEDFSVWTTAPSPEALLPPSESHVNPND